VEVFQSKSKNKLLDSQVVEERPEEVVEAPPKRGRGRPRKVLEPELEPELQEPEPEPLQEQQPEPVYLTHRRD
jgi:hypothetical protein